MRHKPVVILPLASALGALAANGVGPADAKSVPDDGAAINSQKALQTRLRPNTLVSTGESLLGLVVTEQSDGTVVAQHASHASHASHHSHASSR
jgi:hypothetical protein